MELDLGSGFKEKGFGSKLGTEMKYGPAKQKAGLGAKILLG